MMEKNTEDFLKLAPKLTEEDVRRINGTFRGFIFRRRKTGELWTSCCGKHTRPEKPTEAEQEILEAEHIPEPRKAVYMLGAFERERMKERHKCPYCGIEVTVKEVGRTGTRKNLWGYRRGIILKNAGRGIWAIAYEAEKSYVCPGPLSLGGVLTGNPTVILRGVYRFLPGVAEAATNLWWAPNEFGRVRRIFQPGKRRWMLNSPFNCTALYGTSYETLGYEELEGTAFEFCGIRALTATGADSIRLLTLCCFYPRQVEMLWKLGLTEGIMDYIERGVKNAVGIHWDATNPKDFLGVTPKEAQKIAAMGGIETLNTYRRGKGTMTIEEAAALVRTMDYATRKTVVGKMGKYGIGMGKIGRYLKKQQETHGTRYTFLYTLGQEYKDYLIAAEGIGLNLSNPVFAMPKDLPAKHDQVTAEYQELMVEQQRKLEWETYRERYETLRKKYEFTYEGMSVAIPVGSRDIVQEGKTLHHCVGGYATRHVEGKVTILFLRREADQKKRLITIEMSGNKMIQAHGWDDERTACKDNPDRVAPEVMYKDFFEVWLRWLKSGSRRNKNGEPIIGKRRKEKIA